MTRKNSLVSVVIPTFNLVGDLIQTVKSIKAQTYFPIEIIVVDNGSVDGTSRIISQKYPEVRLITLKKNSGVTGGRNRGLREARGEYLLFFDHDMVADKKMISELIKVANLDKKIGIVTGKIYYWGDKRKIWSAGTSVDLLTGRVFFRGGFEEVYNRIEEIQVAPAVFLVKRTVIEKIGGFDDIFFANWEDTDFCFRARKAGFKVYYTPKAIAFHKIPPGKKESTKRLLSRTFYIARNRIIFMRKHSGYFWLFLLLLPMWVFYYVGLSFYFREIKAGVNYLKGTIAGLIIAFLSFQKRIN